MRQIDRQIIVAGVAGLLAMPAFCRQLSVDEAVGQLPERFRISKTRSGLNPLYTQKAGNLNAAYVFSANESEGYVVVAADDLLPSVLGYSDKDGFDTESMPPALKYWLEEYGRQLEYASSHGLGQPLATKSEDMGAISPLCETTWSQSRPYNNNCPSINGRKAPTGCTATALAQVMYTHKWPEKGVGTNSYVSGATREMLEFDFGATTFEWGNMRPSYSSEYSEAQAAAVATLMEACGNAMLMSYGASASGAYPYDAAYGMVRFLGYDRGVEMVRRDYYTSRTWNSMIYSELAEGRPVMYGGYDSSYENGHTFVVDGYDGNGYYHINWGWGGMSNGYFLLTALDPTDQGTGGSGAGYNYRQDGIIRIKPAQGDSEYPLTVMWYGAFSPVNMAYSSIGVVEFSAGSGGYFDGFTIEDTEAVMGVNLTPADGGDTVFYPAGKFDFPSHYGTYESASYEKFSISVSDFPKDGTFSVTPAYLHNGVVKEVAVKVGETRSVIMTCSTRGVKFEIPAPQRTLTADNIKLGNKLYSGKYCSVTAEIHNTGEEYLGMVNAGFENAEGEVRTWLDPVPVNVADGETAAVTFTGVLDSYNTTLPAGKYTLNIFDEAGASICGKPLVVEVYEAPTGTPVIDMALDIDGFSGGDGSANDPYLIGDAIDLTVNVDVKSGLFDDVVALYAYYTDNSELDFGDSSVTYKNFFAAPGEKQSMTYHLVTSDFELDRTAYIRAYCWKDDWSAGSLGWMGRYVYVKRTSSGVSGIESASARLYPNPAESLTTVESASGIVGIDVYSLTGLRMLHVSGNGNYSQDIDVSVLPAGHYVVMVDTVSGRERHRLLKK